MEIEAAGDNEGLYSSRNVSLKINRGQFVRLEELTITKDAIGWKTSTSNVFIPWDKIVVQAIQAEPQRSIYLMIDESWENEAQDPVLPVQNNGNGSASLIEHPEEECEALEEDDDGDEEEQNITEFWLIPEEVDEIDNMYYIMTRCGNSMEGESEDEGEEEFFQGEDIGQMNLNDDDDRFADAE